MRTVTAFEVRRTAGRTIRGDMAKLTATPPRGAIGAGLFLLVSLFLLAAGGVPSAPGPHGIGAFLLDPSTTQAHG